MKEKETGRMIILIAFAVIICLSGIIWFFTGKYLDMSNYEKRQMAEKPKLTVDSYGSFADDYTAYFNDNLPFRNNLITLNAGINVLCFRKISGSRVVIGKDNWLFFDCKEDGDPISCYQGTNLLTEEELAGIAQNCVNQRDFIESQGKEFVILIAPNKERVYSEYMPERYGKPADNYGTLQIYNYLKANTDLRVIYLYDDLMEVKDKLDEVIYYRSDTHWNLLGGYVGASALMKELGIEMPPIYSDSIIIKDNGVKSGDLSDMLHLGKLFGFYDNEFSVEGYETHDAECIEMDLYGMISYHATNADPRSIYVIRDSFSDHMAGYIGSQFTNSYFMHKGAYSYDDLMAHEPDIVVYEVVERCAPLLGTFSVK